MARRFLTICTSAILALMLSGIGEVSAKYRYGSYASGTDKGVYLFGELIWANPRNVDTVVATQATVQNFGGGTNSVSAIVPRWDDQISGRLGLGYQWPNGNQVQLTVWGFQTDQSSVGNGNPAGTLYFAIGPPIDTGNAYVGNSGTPGSYALNTEIEAGTVDLAFGHLHTLTESFGLRWSVGLRYASYDENTAGAYDELGRGTPGFGQNAYSVRKSLNGEMIGVRAALEASYRFVKSVSLDGGLGFSFLDGRLEANSRNQPAGSINSQFLPTAVAVMNDDSRSGSIQDADLRVTWHGPSDSVRVWLGWEQQTWEGITVDSMRNFPGTLAPLRDRDSVTFSGYKIGVYLRF